MQSLCFYILATAHRTSQLSTEAGLKYFILGALSSSLLLFGISLLYGFTGTTNFTEIAISTLPSVQDTEFPLMVHVGILFVLCGILFKLAAVPFHM